MHADGHTDRGKTGFIICPMIHAIAMGQIINDTVTSDDYYKRDWSCMDRIQINIAYMETLK